MSSKKRNIISTSKKEIYSKVLDIAEKYLPVEEYDFAKTGLFAYITETMAMTLRDTAFHAGMMYNESFLNTAIIPKSIYNWAKMFNIEVQKATPAYADIIISIDATAIGNFILDDVNGLSDAERTKYGRDVEKKENFFIIDRDDPIVAGEYYFSLERSIILYKKGDAWYAEYLTTEAEYTTFTKITSTNNTLNVIENGSTINVYARAYQYRMRTYDRKIVSSSFLNKVQTYTFEDQFCGGALYYVENGVKTKIDLTYSDLNSENSSKSAYYNISDEGELELIFKSGDGMFAPAANSNLILKIYTTKGKNVPSKFAGIGSIIMAKTERKSLPITVQFDPTDIYGGKNAPSLSDIKKTIINEMSTRKTITTQADLNSYFNILTALLSEINNGKIKFIKQRDDILRRVYNAYLLVRNNMDDTVETDIANSDSSFVSSCVPTNTFDIDLQKTSSNSLDNVSLFRNPMADISGGTYQSPTPLDTSTEYYQCPFSIFVKLSPVAIVKYIYEAVDKTVRTTITDQGGDWFNTNYIHPSSARIYRGLGNNSLQCNDEISFEFEASTNYDLYNLPSNSLKIKITSENQIIPVEGNLSIRSCTPNDAGTIYNAVLVASFKVGKTENSKYNGVSYFSVGFNTNATNMMVENATWQPDENFKFEISVNNNNYLSFRANDKLPVFRDMSGIMESNVYDDASNGKLRLTEVPLVHSYFINQATEKERREFATQLFNYIEILKENLSRLESSTFFNLKFYNTCGYSYFYHTDRTNIDLDLDIYIRYGNEDVTTLKNQIRSYIRRIVDKTNEAGTGIKYSEITSLLTSAYGNVIDHIEFKGPYDQQYIKPVTDADDDIGYPPEWLSILTNSALEKTKKGIFAIKFHETTTPTK